MRYIHLLPSMPSFDGKGLFGYTFGPLQQRDLEIYYIEVEKGHDTFMVSKRITRIYYVLDGNGYFTIGDRRHDVSRGVLVEVPPKVEYSYSGKMKLIAVSSPRWFSGNDRYTKWNSDVVHGDFPFVTNGGSWKILGKSPINVYLGLNRRLWRKLPPSLCTLGPVRSYGGLLHTLARRHGVRAQAPSTFFLRNRPQLELIRRLIEQRAKNDTLRVAVLGCSLGVEAYSVAWIIRSARPDLKLMLHALDISKWAVEFGKCGRYSLVASQSTDSDIFQRMTEREIMELFDRDGDVVAVKSWIKQGINWQVGCLPTRRPATRSILAFSPRPLRRTNPRLSSYAPCTRPGWMRRRLSDPVGNTSRMRLGGRDATVTLNCFTSGRSSCRCNQATSCFLPVSEGD